MVFKLNDFHCLWTIHNDLFHSLGLYHCYSLRHSRHSFDLLYFICMTLILCSIHITFMT